MNPFENGNCIKICEKKFYYDVNTKERVCLNFDECKVGKNNENNDENDENNNNNENNININIEDFIYTFSVLNSKECVSDCKHVNLSIFNIKCISDCQTTTDYPYTYDFKCYNKCPFPTGIKHNSNNDYTCLKCSDHSLYYYNGICYDKNEIPLNTFFNSSNPESLSSNILTKCFNEIPSENILYTGFNYKINNCSIECPSNYF